MCVLQNLGNFGSELPELECSECDARFSICWQRYHSGAHAIYDEPKYCPFCGDEVEEIIWEEIDA